MSFWSDPWAVTIGGGAAVLGIGFVVRRLMRPEDGQGNGSAKIVLPSGGANVANSGTIGDMTINVAPAADAAARKTEAWNALKLNVASTNKRLRDVIDHIVKGNFTSPALRDALEEVRAEFLRLRSSWVVLDDTDLLQKVEHWHDEIKRTKDDIFNEEGAWTTFMNTSPVHPPEMMILPAKKRLGEYQALLTTGEALEDEVQAQRQAKRSAPLDEERARSRVATRLMLIAGQFSTLAHWLRHTHGLNQIESVLGDIEKLTAEHDHTDLDRMGDVELGNQVIHYFRDTRGAIASVRHAAKTFERARTLHNPEERMATTLQQCRAHAEQNERWGKELAGKIRGER